MAHTAQSHCPLFTSSHWESEMAGSRSISLGEGSRLRGVRLDFAELREELRHQFDRLRAAVIGFLTKRCEQAAHRVVECVLCAALPNLLRSIQPPEGRIDREKLLHGQNALRRRRFLVVGLAPV